jgi:hypothetical protein
VGVVYVAVLLQPSDALLSKVVPPSVSVLMIVAVEITLAPSVGRLIVELTESDGLAFVTVSLLFMNKEKCLTALRLPIVALLAAPELVCPYRYAVTHNQKHTTRTNDRQALTEFGVSMIAV